MAHRNQIEFIKQNKELIREPILLIGSKMYDYDQHDLARELSNLGFNEIIGTDIEDGPGVNYVVDILERDSGFVTEYRGKFATVFCMEVLTHLKNPFVAAEVITSLTASNGVIVLSDVFVRKLSRMPFDFWRFSYDGFKMLFEKFDFYDDISRFSITRQKDALLLPFNRKFEEIIMDEQHKDETWLGFIIRRIHRKFLSKGLFKVSRLMPEQTVYAIGRLKS